MQLMSSGYSSVVCIPLFGLLQEPYSRDPNWPVGAMSGPSCCAAAGIKPMSSLRLKADLHFFENWVKLLQCKGLKDTRSGPSEHLRLWHTVGCGLKSEISKLSSL